MSNRIVRMSTLVAVAGSLLLALPLAGQVEVNSVAINNETIEPEGPSGRPWFHNAQVEGSFQEYAISSFHLSAEDFGGTVASIDSVEISYTQSNAFFSSSGPVAFHITFDTTVSAGDYTGLSHSGSGVGVDDSQYSDTPTTQAVGSGTYTVGDNGDVDTYTLDVSGVEADLVAAINSGEPFSILLVAPSGETAATYAGIQSDNYPDSIILSVTASLESVEDSDNLLTNAGFESGVDGWDEAFNGAGPSLEGDPVVSGNGSLRLDGSGGGFSVPGAQQTFPAEPGQVFNLSGYLGAATGLPDTITFGTLKIVFSDGTSDLIPAESDLTIGTVNTANPGVESTPVLDASNTPGWIMSEAQAVAPPGTVSVSFFVLNINQDPAVMFADDIVAEDVTNDFVIVDPDNLLTNASFESGVDGWDAFNGAVPSLEGDPVNMGLGSLRLDGSGGGFSVPGAFQTVPAVPGQVFNLSGYLGAVTGLPDSITFGTLKIVFSDGTSDLLPAASSLTIGVVNTANPGVESVPVLDDTNSPGWIWSEAQAVAPPGTVSVSFFVLNINQDGAVMFADDILARNVTSELNPIPWDGLAPGTSAVSPWFGAFTVAEQDWLKHADLNWIWVGYVDDLNGMWVYSLHRNAWLWTNQDVFPIVYDSATGDWIYYFVISDFGLGAWVYNYTDGTWTFE